MGYIGNEPTTGHFPVDNFTSSGGSTYTLAKAPASAGAIEVSVQGVLQPTTAYTVSGTTLNMAGVTTGVKIFVRHLGETLVLPTIADGVVTAAKLGTNSVDGTKIAMGSDAAGDLLYHGASDYTRLAKGTASQSLTMNSGATAPEWTTPAAGGAWTKIETSVASDVASLTITGLDSTYDTYAIALSNMVPITDNAVGSIRVGDSGGVDSGSSDYGSMAFGDKIENSSFALSGEMNNNDSKMFLSRYGTGNQAGEGVGGMLFLTHGTMFPTISGHIINVTNTSLIEGCSVFSGRLSVITLDRIQFLFSSGNVSTGRMTVWGISHA